MPLGDAFAYTHNRQSVEFHHLALKHLCLQRLRILIAPSSYSRSDNILCLFPHINKMKTIAAALAFAAVAVAVPQASSSSFSP
jgi:hypothetical protein